MVSDLLTRVCKETNLVIAVITRPHCNISAIRVSLEELRSNEFTNNSRPYKKKADERLKKQKITNNNKNNF